MRQKSRGGKGIEKNLQKSCSKDAADAGRTDSVTKTAGWVDEAIKVNSKDAGIKGFDETDAAGKSQRERHRKSCRKVAVKIRQAPAGPIRQRIHQLGRCDRKIEQQISGRKVAEEMLQQRCGRRRQDRFGSEYTSWAVATGKLSSKYPAEKLQKRCCSKGAAGAGNTYPAKKTSVRPIRPKT